MRPLIIKIIPNLNIRKGKDPVKEKDRVNGQKIKGGF
jgi:hypothetical protein